MRRVLVTGGASGIGKATATYLAESGWSVCAADVTAADGVIEFDVTDESRWDAVLDEYGPFDALVACAGIRDRAPLIDMTADQFDRMVGTHVRGGFFGMRAMARRWQRQNVGGAIVAIASVVATHAVSGQIHYVAAKAALSGMTRAAALELAPYGCRVNAIAPGIIRTPMTADRLADPAQTAWLTSRVPMARTGEPREIATVAGFLLSDAASYVTGAVIPVDGGWTAC